MLQFLKQTRITETPLSVEHVESLLNVLVLDGEIERVIRSSFRRYLPSLKLSTRFLRMVPLFGVLKLSRTMPSLNPSVIPKPNGNTDLARMAMAARKARARNGRTAIQNRTTPLPRHEKRRVESQNAKTQILTANQSESDKNLRLAMTTATKTMRKIGRSERNVLSQSRKNRKAGSNLRTSLPPPRPTLVPNQINPPGVGGLGVHPPSQDLSRKPRNPLDDRHPPHHSRNTTTRARGLVMYTERYDQNVRSRGGLRHRAPPVRVSSSATTKGPSTRRIVCILESG